MLTSQIFSSWCDRVRRQSGFPTVISCQRQDAHVLPKRRQSHQGDKLCDVSTVPLVARWPVLLARGSDADGEPHCSAVTVKTEHEIYWKRQGEQELPLPHHGCCFGAGSRHDRERSTQCHQRHKWDHSYMLCSYSWHCMDV